MAPLISIITVCKNSEKHIAEALQSVENQTYDSIEHIIIDGGSTDNTLSLIDGYKNKADNNVTCISEPDQGMYDALNKGIGLAQGRLVGVLHSNDTFTNEALKIIAKIYSENNGAEGVYRGTLRYISRKGETLGLELPSDSSALSARDINHPAWFVSRTLFKKHGTYDTSFLVASDWDLYLRLRKAGVLFFDTDKEITNYRLGGLSSKKNLKTAFRKTKDDLRILKKNGYSFPTRMVFLFKDDIIIPLLKMIFRIKKGR